MTKQKIIIASVFFLIFIALSWIFFGGSCGQGSRKGAPLRTAKALRADVSDVLKMRGKIIAMKKVPIFSEATGQVTRLYVDQGQAVQKGDLLLEIDKAQLTNDIEKQKINLEKTHINLENAEGEFKRKEALYTEQFISQAEFETAKKSYELAKLDHSISQKELESLTQQLDKVQVTAPISGVITRKNVEEGEVVGSLASGSQSKMMLEIADISQKKIEIFISEADRALVGSHEDVKFWIESSPDKEYAGRILKVDDSPQEVERVSQFHAEIEILDMNVDFTLGISVIVEITVGEAKKAISVPVEAIFYDKTDRFVYIQKGKRYEKRPVETGVSGVDRVEVKKGLKENETVYLDNPAL